MPLLVVTLLPSGRQVSPDVELDATVDVLRQKINDLAGDGNSAPPEMQLLVFGETVLEDGHALREYGLALESELRRSWPKPIWVSLNVGGLCVRIPLDALQAVRGSRISAMFEPIRHGQEPVDVVPDTQGTGLPEGVPYREDQPLLRDGDGAYIIERDGASFWHVLNYLRARRPTYRNGRRVEQLEPELEGDGDEPPHAQPDVRLPDSATELQLLAAEAKHFGLTELEERAQAALQQAQLSGIPPGMIAQWPGNIDTIPAGWALCDGQNGTPDLRDKFVVAAGARFPVGAMAARGEQLRASVKGAGNGPGQYDGITFRSGGEDSHTHRIHFGEPVPAHFALAFIMRRGFEFQGHFAAVESNRLREEMDMHGLVAADRDILFRHGVTTVEKFLRLQDRDFELIGFNIAARRQAKAAADELFAEVRAATEQAAAAADAELRAVLERSEISAEGQEAICAQVGTMARLMALTEEMMGSNYMGQPQILVGGSNQWTERDLTAESTLFGKTLWFDPWKRGHDEMLREKCRSTFMEWSRPCGPLTVMDRRLLADLIPVERLRDELTRRGCALSDDGLRTLVATDAVFAVSLPRLGQGELRFPSSTEERVRSWPGCRGQPVHQPREARDGRLGLGDLYCVQMPQLFGLEVEAARRLGLGPDDARNLAALQATPVLGASSAIFTPADVAHLREWLEGENPRLELLYRASEHGWGDPECAEGQYFGASRMPYVAPARPEGNASGFHEFNERCHNQGPTLLVIKDVQGFVFGAFSSAAWTAGSDEGPTSVRTAKYKLGDMQPGMVEGITYHRKPVYGDPSPGAFLFALRCHAGLGPTKMELVPGKERSAIAHSCYGPTIGAALHAYEPGQLFYNSSKAGPRPDHYQCMDGISLSAGARGWCYLLGEYGHPHDDAQAVFQLPAGVNRPYSGRRNQYSGYNQNGSFLTGSHEFCALEVEVFRVTS